MLIKTFHSQGSDNSVEVGVERISELKDGKSAVTSAFGIWHGCSHELTIGVNNCSRIHVIKPVKIPTQIGERFIRFLP